MTVWLVFEYLKLRSLSAFILLLVLFLLAFIAPFLITPSLYVLNILFLRELFKLFSFKKEQLFFNYFLITLCIFPLYFTQTNLSITLVLNLCLFFFVLYFSKSFMGVPELACGFGDHFKVNVWSCPELVF